jgi:hypothetical protein
VRKVGDLALASRASARNNSDDESSEARWGDSELDEEMHDELHVVTALAADAEAASVDANLRETREADQCVLRLRNENAFEMALKKLKYDDDAATRQRRMFTTPDRTLATYLTGDAPKRHHIFRRSQQFKDEITKLSGADDIAGAIGLGPPTGTSTLVGVLIRFASQAEATEAHGALLELLPTSIWPAFVVGYIPEKLLPNLHPASRFSLSGKNVPAAAPSARSQNVKVSAK